MFHKRATVPATEPAPRAAKQEKQISLFAQPTPVPAPSKRRRGGGLGPSVPPPAADGKKSSLMDLALLPALPSPAGPLLS